MLAAELGYGYVISRAPVLIDKIRTVGDQAVDGRRGYNGPPDTDSPIATAGVRRPCPGQVVSPGRSLHTGVELGAIMDLAAWLRNLGLEQYEAIFRENAIDETVLPL